MRWVIQCLRHTKTLPQINGVKHKNYQTHLSKEFENQQQANNRTKERAQYDHNMKMDESNSRHNQPYPLNKEKNVSNTLSTQMARKTFIK